MKRKLRGGMVGGGIGAFIGPVHRMAATLDGQAEYVAGAFSRDAAKSKKSGAELLMDPERVYGSWQEMIERESRLPPDRRIEFVSIVTPNNTHFPVAKGFLQAGFNVVCDKPMTFTLAEARELREIVEKSERVFALTHNYTGYPMVKQARHMVQNGAVGTINKVVVEYPQGWMAPSLTGEAANLGIWRIDPKIAGAGGSTGDIGTHAENLARYITGLEIDELCAELSAFIPGNQLDDDANVLLRYKGGAKGVLFSSQISTGEENGINIRAYGTKAGLYWNQEDPNYLYIKNIDGTVTRYSRGNDNLCDAARGASRLPFGHPEGFIEGFANVYRAAFAAVAEQIETGKAGGGDFPNVTDGVVGMAFIETVVASAKDGAVWRTMPAV